VKSRDTPHPETVGVAGYAFVRYSRVIKAGQEKGWQGKKFPRF
jgi:hypothetical protein